MEFQDWKVAQKQLIGIRYGMVQIQDDLILGKSIKSIAKRSRLDPDDILEVAQVLLGTIEDNLLYLPPTKILLDNEKRLLTSISRYESDRLETPRML